MSFLSIVGVGRTAQGFLTKAASLSALVGVSQNTESDHFRGESRREERARKKFDRKARSNGEPTSSMLFEMGIFYGNGKPLAGRYQDNFIRIFGRPIPEMSEMPASTQGIANAIQESQANDRDSIEDRLGIPLWAAIALGISVIGIILLLFFYPGRKRRGKRRK